jgi:hypothetical protein
MLKIVTVPGQAIDNIRSSPRMTNRGRRAVPYHLPCSKACATVASGSTSDNGASRSASAP